MIKSSILPLFIALAHIPFFLIKFNPYKDLLPKQKKILINTIYLIDEPTFSKVITKEVTKEIIEEAIPQKPPAIPPLTPKKTVSKISKKKIQKSINKSLNKKVASAKNKKTKLNRDNVAKKIAKNDALKEENEYTLYLEQLTKLLQGHLTLPEAGKVKLVITVQSNGKVAKIRSLIVESEANLNYLLNHIKEIKFPEYTKKEDRIFTIVFCDE